VAVVRTLYTNRKETGIYIRRNNTQNKTKTGTVENKACKAIKQTKNE
jgi:hypothetical protein